LGIFSYEIHKILCSNVIVFTFEYQAWIKMADIKQKYYSTFFFNSVIIRFKILEKLRFFPKWALWMRHQVGPLSTLSLAFLTYVLEILSYTIQTNLRYKIIVSTFEGQAKITMVDIKWKY
jgi:hypothetical protein